MILGQDTGEPYDPGSNWEGENISFPDAFIDDLL